MFPNMNQVFIRDRNTTEISVPVSNSTIQDFMGQVILPTESVNDLLASDPLLNTTTITPTNISINKTKDAKEWEIYYSVHKFAQMAIVITILVCGISHLLYLICKWCITVTEEDITNQINKLKAKEINRRESLRMMKIKQHNEKIHERTHSEIEAKVATYKMKPTMNDLKQHRHNLHKNISGNMEELVLGKNISRRNSRRNLRCGSVLSYGAGSEKAGSSRRASLAMASGQLMSRNLRLNSQESHVVTCLDMPHAITTGTVLDPSLHAQV